MRAVQHAEQYTNQHDDADDEKPHQRSQRCAKAEFMPTVSARLDRRKQTQKPEGKEADADDKVSERIAGRIAHRPARATHSAEIDAHAALDIDRFGLRRALDDLRRNSRCQCDLIGRHAAAGAEAPDVCRAT